MIEIRDVLAFLDSDGIQYSFYGDEKRTIDSFCSLNNYKDDCITWVKSKEYIPKGLDGNSIALIITNPGIETGCPNVISTPTAKRAFFRTVEHFFKREENVSVPRSMSFISDKAIIGNNISIGVGCFIGDHVTIADNVVLGNYVSINGNTYIGANSSVGSGTAMGNPGFGFVKDSNNVNHRVAHYGGIWIGENTEIGDNCVIHRGTIDDTYIGNNVKIEALKLIPHNAYIGDRCLILGSLGGSCRIGEDSYIALNSVVLNQIKVGRNCMVNTGTVLAADLPDGCIADRNRVYKMNYRRILHLD